MTIATINAFLAAFRTRPIYEGDPADDQRVAELMRLSGLDEQLRLVGALALDALNDPAAPVPPPYQRHVQSIVADVHRYDEVCGAVTSRLRQEVESRFLGLAIEWFRTPFSRRIVRLEKAAATTQALELLPEFAQSYKSAPPESNRLALLARIDAAAGATELAAELVIHKRWISMVCAEAVSDIGRDPRGDRIRRLLEGRRENVTRKVRQLTALRLAFVFEELHNTDLQRYLAFLESDGGLWFNGLIADAVRSALQATAAGLQQALHERLPAR